MAFDRSVRVATNDLVVVHMSSTCGTAPDETLSVVESPQEWYSANLDTAWDWYASFGDLAGDALALVVRDPDGNVLDAFVGHRAAFPGTVRADALSVATSLLTSGEWTASPTPSSMTAMVFYDVALRDVMYAQSRMDDLDTNTRFDWDCSMDGRCLYGTPAPSWGLLNEGQVTPE